MNETRNLEQRRCKKCDVLFIPKWSAQRFCSDLCRQQYEIENPGVPLPARHGRKRRGIGTAPDRGINKARRLKLAQMNQRTREAVEIEQKVKVNYQTDLAAYEATPPQLIKKAESVAPQEPSIERNAKPPLHPAQRRRLIEGAVIRLVEVAVKESFWKKWNAGKEQRRALQMAGFVVRNKKVFRRRI
jgi:hypothetical protein